jgi:hypothetical protein
MKLIKFSLMKKRGDSMMHSVNEDLREDFDDDNEVLILEIFDDSEDFEVEKEWILI